MCIARARARAWFPAAPLVVGTVNPRPCGYHGHPRGRSLIERAVRELGLSARAYVRVLRVARTIADLESRNDVTEAHVAEAIQGRVIEGR